MKKYIATLMIVIPVSILIYFSYKYWNWEYLTTPNMIENVWIPFGLPFSIISISFGIGFLLDD